MLEEGLLQQTTKPPSRQTMAHWCIDALNEISPQTISNAWRHGKYSYFPQQESVTAPDDEANNSLDDMMYELEIDDEEEV